MATIQAPLPTSNTLQLGDFLRKKRDNTAPEEVGVNRLARSRARGLRREDVAERAGISTAWYIKLERGSAEKPSRDVLLRVASALQCTDAETQYMLDLSGYGPLNASTTPTFFLSQSSQRLLRSINPIPALFIDENYDILQTNAAFDCMIGLDINALAPQERNFALLVLTSPQFKRFHMLDTEELEERHISHFAAYLRKLLGSRAEEREWKDRLARWSQASLRFQTAWERREVTIPEMNNLKFCHAQLGVMTLHKQLWWSRTGETGGRLQVFVPDNDADEQRLAACLTDQKSGQQGKPIRQLTDP